MKNQVYIRLTIVSTIIYLIWRIFFTIPYDGGKFVLIWGIILLSFEVFGFLESIIHFRNMMAIEYPERPVIEESEYPDVDVFIATYNEPVELLYKTVNGCLIMDYPDKNKVHIYICDDNNREEMKALADHLGVNYITRLEKKGAKAGNFNNALSKTYSPLIVTFDADMIPMHDFLTATVPYFFMENEKIGFVQTPQSFYNPDLFQFYLYSEGRVPNEQDYFYRDIQVGRNRTNSVIYGGSNTVISRKALEEIGGFYTKVITEDFATGMLIQSKGYKCIAIGETHASGLSPSDLKSLIKQRDRWARGCIQTARKLNILFRKGLNMKQKLSYISSITYWYSPIKRLVYIVSPLLYGIFDIRVVETTLGQVLIFWLPSYVLNRITLRKVSKNIRSLKWTNVYETILFPSLLVSVVLETLCISKKSFSVTKKDGVDNDKAYRRKAAVPHAVLAVLSIFSIFRCIEEMFISGSISAAVVLFWLGFNFYTIIMSLFFMLGRDVYRSAERFKINAKCILKIDEKQKNCRTLDISETGLSIYLATPEYIPYEKIIEFTVITKRYESTLYGKLVHVDNYGEGFKYAFKINKADEENTKSLLDILYDREPSLPKEIENDNSVFDDLRINILTRRSKSLFYHRMLPRIIINKSFMTDKEETVFVENFNFEYVLIKTYEEAEKINILVDENVIFKCSIYKSYKDGDGVLHVIYSIENYREFIDDEDLKKKFMLWHKEDTNIRREKERSSNEIEFDENEFV